jgi:hypothetical protein
LDPEHFQVPFGGWPVVPVLPPLLKKTVEPLGQFHVPTIRPQAAPDDISRVFAAARFG